MNTATSVVIAGGLAALGTWVRDKQVTFKMVIGIGMLALFLSVIAEYNAEFAQQMAVLVLVGAVFMYGPELMTALKLTAP